jgi:hypothetical protein
LRKAVDKYDSFYQMKRMEYFNAKKMARRYEGLDDKPEEVKKE